MSMDNARRVLTIEFQFEISARKAFEPRLKAAYERAVEAAGDAVRGELLEGSVSKASSRMSYDYRYLEQAGEEVAAANWPEEDDDS